VIPSRSTIVPPGSPLLYPFSMRQEFTDSHLSKKQENGEGDTVLCSPSPVLL
jgi:hypothetical protein